ncbi:hypothetical protein ASG29_06560 [Sphingomonas sp. Leaf412]|uniref:hypothetical protein n=1 Tax=Sphingomonas sp. Leaf412 TaxID=1736370 RepID=UPI0006F5FB91|nr:hypothetical protein [Sphingomonas sp. Leaf412]KQT33668.1 hypothetical protein ASG29_06560 [Sphingomonas sp. Leaf412]
MRDLTWRVNAAMRHGVIATEGLLRHVAAEPLITAVERRLSSSVGGPGDRPRLIATTHIDRLGVQASGSKSR